MTDYVHPSIARLKVHFWIEYYRKAVCGQPDSPVRRSSRRIDRVTCLRCQRWHIRHHGPGVVETPIIPKGTDPT